MAHNCSTVIVNCMDFRLVKTLQDWAKKQGLEGDFDLVSLGGSAMNIVDVVRRDFMFKQLEISVGLHHAKRVILINHQDCGAYGGSEAFESAEAEKAKHEEDLKRSKELVLTKFPDVKVELYYMTQKDDNWEMGNPIE